ncbi:hypothetical protein TL16_g11543 [Triparma laevis f. inornata]|uniref:subtilisin n=1 Tax=Triparma laevis f. inornata TaxID=1714386 RepID=A0A9W7ET41_9STRA|nr:hypothetical protein TL16_g11543 [Triparma laevis f. inornata]
MVALSLIFGLGALLQSASAAPRPLTLSSLNEIVGSDASPLHGSEPSFATGSAHTWARHEQTEATFRRLSSLSSETSPQNTVPRAGYVICEDTPSLDGFTRRGRIEAGLQTTLSHHAFFNTDSMTCFQAHLTFEQASGAPEDLIVHPLTHAMKVSDVDKALANPSMNSHAISLHLCPSQEGTAQALSQKWEAMAGDLFGANSEHHTNLREAFFWSREEHRAEANTDRAHQWHEAIQVSADSQFCHSVVSHLGFKPEHAPLAHINTVHVSNMDGFFDAITSAADRAHAEACFLSVIALLSEQPEVCHLAQRYRHQIRNDEAQWIVQSNQPSGPSMRPFYDAGITGEGQVVAVSDTGLDTDNCYFRNSASGTDASGQLTKDGTVQSSKRKVIQYVPLDRTYGSDRYTSDTDYEGGHGTHVAGSVLGRKSTNGNSEGDGFADGIAYDAKLAFFDVGWGADLLLTPDTASELIDPGYDAGARIHSASWGTSSNRYEDDDFNFDSYTYANEEFLILVAAGNDGTTMTCKSAYDNDGNGDCDQCADGIQPEECPGCEICYNGCNNLQDAAWCQSSIMYNFGRATNSVGSPAIAKNILAVGATESENGDLGNGQIGRDYMAEFSSIGPAEDGRIKPDIVAPGMGILSACARPGENYECDPSSKPTGGSGTYEGIMFMSGTSMATPVASGTAALVRQYFMDGFYPTGAKVSSNAMTPSAALVKAVLMGSGTAMTAIRNKLSYLTADTTPSSMYDNAQGFGRITIGDALKLNGFNDITTKVYDAKVITAGATDTYIIDVGSCSSTSDLVATLVWTDAAAIRHCTKCLVNDLDLSMSKGSTTYYPNKVTASSNPPRDELNNAEKIVIENASDGDNYMLTVKARNIQNADGTQKYSLVVSGCDVTMGDGTPSPTPFVSQAPTEEGTTPAPTEAPTRDPSTSSPTVSPPNGNFCEVWIPYENLKLEYISVNAKEFDDTILKAFQEVIADVGGVNVVDHTYVCFVATGGAGSEVGADRRKLSNPSEQYHGINVDFKVTAVVPDHQDCSDEQAMVDVVLDVAQRIQQSITLGTMQSKLRAKDTGTWLDAVEVDATDMSPSTPNLATYGDNVSTYEDRYCTNWKMKQWLMENLQLLIGAGVGSLVLCCCCGFVCAWLRSSSSSKKYKNQNIQMTRSHARAPYHPSTPQKGGIASITGFKGGQTRNASAAARMSKMAGGTTGGG